MNYKKILSFLSIAYCSSLYPMAEYTINEKKPIDVVFSKNSHNRIAVDQGSVEKIFGDEKLFNIQIDQTTGNAFVKLKKDITVPTTLTVVTSSGLTQDLYIISEDVPSEHLILKEIISEEEKETISNFTIIHTTTVEFLNRILENKTPIGYGKRDTVGLLIPSLPEPLSVEIIKAFESAYENIVVYKISNLGKTPVVLSSESLNTNGINWIFLNSHELRAKEGVVCIMSMLKEEI